MSEANGYQKQPNSRSSAHPQQDTTVVSLASLTSFVCLSHGDYVCVFGVCTQRTPPCSCMICTASVGGRIYAARCQSASLKTTRLSAEHAENRYSGEWPASSASLVILSTISVYQGSQSQQHRNSSEPCQYEYEYVSSLYYDIARISQLILFYFIIQLGCRPFLQWVNIQGIVCTYYSLLYIIHQHHIIDRFHHSYQESTQIEIPDATLHPHPIS